MKTAGSLLFSLVDVTPRRTFIFFPAVALLFQFLVPLRFGPYNILALPLIPAGYLQYRFCGRYVKAHGGGGPSPRNPPKMLVTTGPYRYVRNPMYTGHMVFLLGVTLFLSSYIALILLLVQAAWLRRNALKDEAVLHQRYGEAYVSYRNSVPRWLPRFWKLTSNRGGGPSRDSATRGDTDEGSSLLAGH